MVSCFILRCWGSPVKSNAGAFYSGKFSFSWAILHAIWGFPKNSERFNLELPISESIGERFNSTVVSDIAKLPQVLET
jgi:hypothetical protein